ncbi:MAG: hypothetical protein GXO26_08235 [Crenarchaeota archaeon]|nr:hypothetical protein [Thermoproteota archaeon]
MSLSQSLLRIEEELRNLATELQEARTGRDTYSGDRFLEVYHKLVDVNLKLESIYRTCLERSETEKPLQLFCRLIYNIYLGLNDLIHDMNKNCNVSNGVFTCLNINVEKIRRELCNNVLELTGRKCGNLILYDTSLQPPAIIDGIANCVHVLAEELMKMETWRRVGRCYLNENSSRSIVELCEKWSEYINRFDPYYMSEDIENVFGYGIDGKAYFRVGSAAGHAANIDFNSGTFTYYDNDLNVVSLVHTYVEKYMNGACMFNRENSELKCTIPNIDKKIDDIAYLLASVTSMDIRLANANVDAKKLIPIKIAKSTYNYDREIALEKGLENTSRTYITVLGGE